MKKLCVIIPVYKTELNAMEEESVFRTFQILASRDICFVAPEGLDITYYLNFFENREPNFVFLEKEFFEGIQGYNKLMLDPAFYNRFSNYEYMLIAQPDAYILSDIDEMDTFIEKGYSYWGAPWNPYLKVYRLDFKGARHFGFLLSPVVCKSGNGGFSLRHIQATIRLLTSKKFTVKTWCNNYNEDGFFAYFAHSKMHGWFTCPTESEAEKFALEADMKIKLSSGYKVFAVHAWEKMLSGFDELKKYIR